MKINELIWLPEIVEKLEVRHHVSQEEVEEIFENKPYFQFQQKGHRKGENLYFAIAQTNSGRYLIVLFIYKKNKKALIVSARDAGRAKRKLYAERRR